MAPGDTLVVWRLDRLGRSMVHLVTVIEELLRRQVGFRPLCDGAIDTTTRHRANSSSISFRRSRNLSSG
jgi:DNA invertase Pin-like site-specific DNA recombinase